jgi:hypothetical protein
VIRKPLQEKGLGIEPGFRWRGGEISRIEGFSDAVFAFAVTLLVISLEPFKTFSELETGMLGFVGFGISFLMLMLVWNYHYRFFRRYGLNDAPVMVLNTLLLFLLLFYVYPLKFLFNMLGLGILSLFTTVPDIGSDVITSSQWPELMIIYSLGFMAVHIIFVLFYLHAYRRREQLALNPLEVARTVMSAQSFLILAGIGLLSILIAWTRIFGPASSATWAGLVYMLIMPALTVHGALVGPRYRHLEEQYAGKPGAESTT